MSRVPVHIVLAAALSCAVLATCAHTGEGCGADRDCKLDRVCEAGHCVWPHGPGKAAGPGGPGAAGPAAPLPKWAAGPSFALDFNLNKPIYGGSIARRLGPVWVRAFLDSHWEAGLSGEVQWW